MSKVKLNKTRFKRRKNRNNDFLTFFGEKAHDSILFAWQIFVNFFLTPVIAISCLISQQTFLILSNIALALSYLASFMHKLYKGKISKTEGIVTLLSIALVVGLTVYFSISLFPLTLSFLSILSFSGLIASAINGFFIAKPFVMPLIKRLCDGLLTLIYKKILGKEYIPTPLYNTTPLTPDNDAVAVNTLLDGAASSIENNRLHSMEEYEKRLKPYNALIKLLDDYINKYQDRFLGVLRFDKKINDLRKALEFMTEEGNQTDARDFLEKKLRWELAKITALREERLTLIQAFKTSNIGSYNKIGRSIFTDFSKIAPPPSTNDPRKIEAYHAHLQERHQTHLSVLEKALEKQVKKAERLSAILKDTAPLNNTKFTNKLPPIDEDEQALKPSFTTLLSYSIFNHQAETRRNAATLTEEVASLGL